MLTFLDFLDHNFIAIICSEMSSIILHVQVDDASQLPPKGALYKRQRVNRAKLERNKEERRLAREFKLGKGRQHSTEDSQPF